MNIEKTNLVNLIYPEENAFNYILKLKYKKKIYFYRRILRRNKMLHDIIIIFS